ncbi:MAG TPA: hypothetical protein VKQ72_20865, partial [Aggregatilineales bacterium]|nr:hypothetical protein [Aggregatilineales bacterium]
MTYNYSCRVAASRPLCTAEDSSRLLLNIHAPQARRQTGDTLIDVTSVERSYAISGTRPWLPRLERGNGATHQRIRL